MARSDLIHGRAMSFATVNHPAGGRRIRFRAPAFTCEALQHAIGIPLLQGHHYARPVGTVTQMWTTSVGLMFAAQLGGAHAELGRHLVQEGVHLSISGLFSTTRAYDGVEDVDQMHWLQELSLVRKGASPWTWARFGRPANAPMRPIKWWTGAPPLPASLSPAMRAKAQRRLKYKTQQGQIHGALERIDASHRRVEAVIRARVEQ